MSDESKEKINTENRAGSPGSDDVQMMPTEASAADQKGELPSVKPSTFNLDKFRLKGSHLTEHACGKKLLTTIPVRRPSKEVWFRSHPDPSFRFPACLIELKELNETYLVDSELWPHLGGESTFVTKELITVMSRQQNLLIWPIRLPGADGRIDPWNASAMEAANMARDKWIRLSPNRSLGAYEILEGRDPQASVEWPDQPFDTLLKIAFKGRVIESLDHPVIRQLRGM
jgi:hypothetical protein